MTSAGPHRWGKPFRTPEQGLPKTQMASVQNAPISRLPPSPPCHPYTHTHWHPRVDFAHECGLMQAGECRAQLGPTAAVYLIKTWEDPSVARPKGDTDSMYRVVKHTHTPTQGGAQILPFVLRDHCPLPKWIQHVFVCQGVNVVYLSAILFSTSVEMPAASVRLLPCVTKKRVTRL